MKKIIAGLIFFIIIILFSGCHKDTDPLSPTMVNLKASYYPLKVGNVWNYTGAIDTIITSTYKVKAEIEIDYTKYYLVKMSYRDDLILRNDALGRIWRHIDGKDYLWFDFTLPDGSTYLYSYIPEFHPPYPYVVTVRKGFTVYTRLGTFYNCIKLSFFIPQARDDNKYTYMFAQGVGIIKKSGYGFGGIIHSYEVSYD